METIPVTTPAVKSPLPGIKVLLEGGSGTGKTHVLRTLIEAGVTPFCLFTENSYDVLGDVPSSKLHWHYIDPTAGSLDTLKQAATRTSIMNADQIQKFHDVTRAQTNSFIPLLDQLMNFRCQRTGKEFGNVGLWGTDRALCLDSLSGVTIAATKLAVGEKYAMTQPEFQIAMKTIENLLNQLCTGFHCHVVVTAHIEREIDEVLGGARIFPSTLGRKLAPVLPRYFTDVVMAKRAGTKFFWDTADPQADLKARNLPISPDLPPSFRPLIEAWKRRGGIIETPAVVTA